MANAPQKIVDAQPFVVPDEFREYEGPSLQGQYAGFLSRAIAFVVDVVLVTVSIIVIGSLSVLIINTFHIDVLLDRLLTSLFGYSAGNTLLGWAASVLSVSLFAFLYSTVLHTITGGKTLGKGLMGLRVVRMDGLPLTYGRSVRRYIGLILAALPLFIGLLWVLVDDRRQGWHDKFAATCVIYDWPAHENGSLLSNLSTRLAYMRDARTVAHNADGS